MSLQDYRVCMVLCSGGTLGTAPSQVHGPSLIELDEGEGIMAVHWNLMT